MVYIHRVTENDQREKIETVIKNMGKKGKLSAGATIIFSGIEAEVYVDSEFYAKLKHALAEHGIGVGFIARDHKKPLF